MRRACVWTGLLLALAAGCRSRSDLVEAELRTRDRQLRELHDEYLRTRTMNEALENTVRDTRGVGGVTTAANVLPVKEIQIARGTGGIDEDRCPGDEGLLVILVPRDPDGHPLKANGTLHLDVIEISPEGTKAPLSTHDFTSLQLRNTWQTGFLSTGYHLKLPWTTVPHFERLRLVAQFTPLGGATYEAEKDVTVRLAVAAPASPLLPPAPAPANIPVLPPPRPAVVAETPPATPASGSYLAPPVPDPNPKSVTSTAVGPTLPLTEVERRPIASTPP